MIRDLSETLRKILDDPNLPEPLQSASIVFERPTEQFNPTQTTVNLFLYDIRENLELRNNEPVVERTNGQAIVRRPPLRVACSYLVTAWPVGGADLPLQEHQLLSQVLQILSYYPTIPSDFLRNTNLDGQEPPLPMVVLHQDNLKNISEFWTSIGNKLRPSLTVTATFSMDVTLTPEKLTLVKTSTAEMQEQSVPANAEKSFRIGGRVTNTATPPKVIAGATVVLVEAGLTTKTDASGRYSLGIVPSGTYTIRVQSGTSTAVREGVTIPASEETNYNVQLAE